jgi:hypothetical protein
MGKKISHPWLYSGLLVAVWLCMTYISTVRESNQEKNHEGFYTGTGTDADEDALTPLVYSTTRLDNTNMFPDYHDTEKQIRLDNKHKMNVFYVKGADGKPVGINMETTQNLPTFYTPGSFQYSASNYVPTYEDSVNLSSLSIDPTYNNLVKLAVAGSSKDGVVDDD